MLTNFPVQSATLTWTGGGGDSNIANAANWSPSQVPAAADTLIFAGSTGVAPQLATSSTAASLTFGSGASPFTVAGSGTYTVNSGGVVNSGTATQTINTAIKLGAAQTWNASTGNLAIGGNVNNNSFLLTVTGSQNTTISGNISGSGGLKKLLTGTLTLTGSNSYAGTTTVSAGTLAIGNDSAVGAGTLSLGTATILASGSARRLANALSLAGNTIFSGTNDLTFNGAANMTSSRSLSVAGSGVVTFAGNIGQSKNSTFTKTGTGMLVLNGTNTFSNLTASAGTLVLGNNAATGAGTLSLAAATIQAGGTSRTFANNVTLSGNSIYSGTNDLTFTGPATLTAARTLTVSNTTTFSGVISGAFALTKSGTGTLVFSGASANTYSGTLTVNDGTLALGKTAGVNAFAGTTLLIGDSSGGAGSAIVQLNASNQMPTVAITIANDGQLNLQSFTDTVGGVTMTGGSIVGAATARLDLGGDVSLSALNSDTGTISAGLGLNANRTFTVNDNADATDIDLAISGVISNGSATSALTKSGSGTMLLSASNSYSGGTNINAGTLLVDGTSALGFGTTNLGNTSGNSNATLSFNTSGGRTLSNAIVARAGTSGTLTLGGLNTSGTNTFSGTILLNKNVIVSAAGGGEIDFNGVISGTGFGFTKIGAGTVKLNAVETFTGLTTVSAGTLAWGVNNALSGAVTIDGATAVLDLGTSRTGSVGTVILDNGGSIIGAGRSCSRC